MNLFKDFNPEKIKGEDFITIVEIAKGSKTKYELDKETGALKLDRILYTSTHYPANYGFIPCTLADDGDPIDVLLIMSESILPLTEVHSLPIGVIVMSDQGKVDEKIIAICPEDPTYQNFKDISELPKHILEEISYFFETYKFLEGKETFVSKPMNHIKAIEAINRCIKRFNDTYKK